MDTNSQCQCIGYYLCLQNKIYILTMSGSSRLARGAREKAHRFLKEVPRLTFQNIKVCVM